MTKDLFGNSSDSTPQKETYRVLARKYRPQDFDGIIGQDVLVTTMFNAINSNKIAHAIMLTGIRGVGKTTTARIIARTLNCIGADGLNLEPSTKPCGICTNCKSITDGRHQDVLEIDAASHTGVDDVRELIENAKYKPISARYKVYIIDEVHMLSISAFNALLKTLEEPPGYVKFILATTDIRKIPLTILSRCQRFDLKRISIEDLAAHYGKILEKECIQFSPEAMELIASAAGGSVRDGLSLLDQAIARGNGNITAQNVQEMLGKADRQLIYKLFDHLSHGLVAEALNLAADLRINGAEPASLLQELLHVVHIITKTKVMDGKVPSSLMEQEAIYAKSLSALPMSYLNRAWQMLLFGYDEVRKSFEQFITFEMLIIRICHASTLPSLEDLISGNHSTNTLSSLRTPTPSAEPAATSSASLLAEPETLQDIANLCIKHNELILSHHLMSNIEIVEIANNNIKVNVTKDVPRTFAHDLESFLNRTLTTKWSVQILAQQATLSASLHMQSKKIADDKKEALKQHELIKTILDSMPEMEIDKIELKEAL